jgi:hypothetical protein
MQTFRPINLHQTRDFSRKMNATFEFVRQNFKSLGKAILLIAGPPVLLASLLMGSFFQDFMTAAFNAGRGGSDGFELFTAPSFWLQIVLMMVFIIVSTVATIATVNNYIVLYDQKQSNQIEMSEIWDRVRSTFWMYLGTAIQLTIIFIIFYVAMIMMMVFVGAGSVGIGFLLFFVVLTAMVYLFFGSALVFIIRTYERVSFVEAFSRSFRLVYGKWWSTFGLIIVLYIIVVAVSYIFLIPFYIIMFVTALHNVSPENMSSATQNVGVVTTVLMTLYYLVQMLMYALPNIGIAFQYFNLVERKEARGLMNDINSIGQAPPPATSTDETY